MSAELLIADDDPLIRSLTDDLLREAGFRTRAVGTGSEVIAALREERPRGVLLDIMMPGVDGLTLCQTIKNDPELRHIKVIMISAKAFPSDKNRAAQFGADLYLQKPFDVGALVETVVGLVGRPESPGAAVDAPHPPAPAVKVRVWGSRSLPAGSTTPAEGLRTPCVSIEAGEYLVALDAGTGIEALGRELAGPGAARELWLLLTHFHPAHVQGLGLFGPTRAEGFTLKIGGPAEPGKVLESQVRKALEESFPFKPEPIRAKLELYEFHQGEFDLAPDLRLRTVYTKHPGTTLAYCVESCRRRVVYCPDGELYGTEATSMEDYDEMLGRFCRGADLLIHDGRYTPEDHARRRGEGHSGFLDAVEFAAEEGIRHLVLFHQDASYPAGTLLEMERLARERLRAKRSDMACDVAREGLEIAL